MKPRIVLAALVALVATVAVTMVGTAGADSDDERKRSSYEVWLIDQQDSRPDGGGTLHVFQGDALSDDAASAKPASVDLGAEAREMCVARTGSAPRRPHMLVFNGGEDEGPAGNTHAVIAFVVTGHVLILDASTREPIDCLRATPGDAGRQQVHAVWPTPDQRYLILANQNGKKLERIRTDWQKDDFELEAGAQLSLYEGTTPSGALKQDPALRPDNAPICPRTTDDGALTFVTLRGGGMFVVDHAATPMRITAEYDRDHVDDNGCGEMQVGGKMFVNSGAGAPGDLSGHDVYAFDLGEFTTEANAPNAPAPRLVYSRDSEGQVDAHAVSKTRGGRYLWWGDRVQNDVTVVNPRRERVVGSFSLVGEHSDDPAPDLFDLSPRGRLMFASLRGPVPQSGGHDAVGSTPGVGVIEPRRGGRSGRMVGVARVPGPSLDVPADPHAIRVRNLP